MNSSVSAVDHSEFKKGFDQNGFAVARNVFSTEEITEIREAFEKINQDGTHDFDDGVHDSNDPLSRYPRIVHPHRFSNVARHYMLHPNLREYVTALFEEEPVVTQTMYYFKPPGARGQAFHQDNLSLLIKPGTCIAAWTAIDPADSQNGGMLVVPGSHRGNLICEEKANAEESFTMEATPIPEGLKPFQVEMQAGDTLFFGGSLIHGSGPNRTKDRFRRSFITHYAAGSLEKISKFYLPLIKMDGTDYEVEGNLEGGVCGKGWMGAVH